jgi:hypothetical protein
MIRSLLRARLLLKLLHDAAGRSCVRPAARSAFRRCALQCAGTRSIGTVQATNRELPGRSFKGRR